MRPERVLDRVVVGKRSAMTRDAFGRDLLYGGLGLGAFHCNPLNLWFWLQLTRDAPLSRGETCPTATYGPQRTRCFTTPTHDERLVEPGGGSREELVVVGRKIWLQLDVATETPYTARCA